MYQRIQDASDYLASRVITTPMIQAPGLAGAKNIYFKCENLQKTGSFKVRGAYYRISKLTPEEKRRGIIACSAGNHAQGVARAAKEAGVKAVICMPEHAPISKVEKTRAYGAEVVLVPGVFDDAMIWAQKLEKEEGYVFIHPFNDLDVIAGQGTLGLEILQQVPDVDLILVAVGGGGLLAGISTVLHRQKPDCRVIGVEPQGAASMKESIHQNRICTLETVRTIADGVAVKSPGTETFSLCQQHADDFVTVSENEITLAILTLLEDYKILVEGAGAAPVAAALYHKVDLSEKNVVCVVSGGNVDVNMVERIISKGLKQTGRVLKLSTLIPDRPGELSQLLEIVSGEGANILSVHHDRTNLHANMDECIVEISFETRDLSHQQQVVGALRECGYKTIRI